MVDGGITKANGGLTHISKGSEAHRDILEHSNSFVSRAMGSLTSEQEKDLNYLKENIPTDFSDSHEIEGYVTDLFTFMVDNPEVSLTVLQNELEDFLDNLFITYREIQNLALKTATSGEKGIFEKNLIKLLRKIVILNGINVESEKRFIEFDSAEQKLVKEINYKIHEIDVLIYNGKKFENSQEYTGFLLLYNRGSDNIKLYFRKKYLNYRFRYLTNRLYNNLQIQKGKIDNNTMVYIKELKELFPSYDISWLATKFPSLSKYI